MKAMVIYDSVFGNTEKVARAMGEALSGSAEVSVAQAGAVGPEQLRGLDLVIVGSPTRGFRPTEGMAGLLKSLPAGCLAGVRAAAFDTRLSLSDTPSAFVRFIVRTGGYAAKPIAERLGKLGARLAVEPEGFLVTGEQGPLKAGELERAAEWARKAAQN